MSVIYSGTIQFSNIEHALINKVLSGLLGEGFFIEGSGRTITFSGSLSKNDPRLKQFIENHSGCFDYCRVVGISDEEPFYCFFDGETFLEVGVEDIKGYARSMLEHLSLTEGGRQILIDRFALDPKEILFSLNERAYSMRYGEQKKSA